MEENKNSITYDENWQQVSKPVYVTSRADESDEQPDSEPVSRGRRRSRMPLLLTVQLALCLLMAAATFAVKGIGGDPYKQVSRWYRSRLNSVAIFDGRQSLDLSRLFSGATADELHR